MNAYLLGVDIEALEIAFRLDELGYPGQAEKLRSDDRSGMLVVARFLAQEAEYIKDPKAGEELQRHASSLRLIFQGREPLPEPAQDASLVEIAAQLEGLGYPGQAAKVRQGRPELLHEVADWLRTEAGYAPGVASELRGYAAALGETAALESLL